MRGFAVVLDEYGRPDAHALAAAFERALGMHRLDAVREADRAGAFVREDLARSEADALREALAGAGVATHVVPPEQVVRPDEPDCVRTVRILEDALEVTTGYSGPTVTVPWDRVVLLSGGEVTDSESVAPKNLIGDAVARGSLRNEIGSAEDGLDVSAAQSALREMEIEHKADLGRRREFDVQLADVIARGDDRVLRFRLRSRDLYYGRILGSDSTRDFRRDFPEVLRRIGERATRAFVTAGYRVLALGGEASGCNEDEWRFGTPDDVTRFGRWRLQTILLGVGDAAAGRAEPFLPSRASAPAPPPSLRAAVPAGAALVAPRPEGRPTEAPRLALDPHDLEMLRFERKALRGFEIAGRAFRGASAGAFALLIVWAWLRPEGLVPFGLLGLALGDMGATLYVLVSPGFSFSARNWQLDGIAFQIIAYVCLANGYWGGVAFKSVDDFAFGVLIVAGAAGAALFGRLFSIISSQTSSLTI